MGKTAKGLINPDKERSVRNVLEKCIKKKKRKKDLDDLRQQVIKKKQALKKNPNLVKAQKTTFEKTLAEFAGRRQAIDDNTQSKGKLKKPGQKKICSKLLADPFVGIFRNGVRGKEVSRKQGFFNETDNARVNGDVFGLLQGDDSKTEGLGGKTTQISPEHRKVSKNTKKSPVLVKSPMNKRKIGLIQGTKAEKSDQKRELNGILLSFDSSSTEKLEEDSDDDHKRERDKLVRKNNNFESKSSSFIYELSTREKCKKLCDAMAQQFAPENCFMSTERDPLKAARQSLKSMYADSHRQRLLRNKAECSRNENVPTSCSVDSIETQGLLNRNKEKTQHKKLTKKYAASSSTISFISKITQNSFASSKDKQLFNNNLLPWKDDTTKARKFPKEYEVNIEEHHEKGMDGNSGQDSKYAPVILRRSNKSMQNAFKDAFRENPQISPLNLSHTDSEIKDFEKSLFDEEAMKLNNWMTLPKTPKKKKVSCDEHSHIFKSKLNFVAAKSRQREPIVPSSSSGEFFTTGNAEEKKKHVVNFEDLFDHKTSYQFSYDCQKTVDHHNSMLQQRRNSSDFKSQVRRDDQHKRQDKNTQGINQQVSECPVIFLQSEPQSYPQKFLPSFYPSQLQNLTSSHMKPAVETLNTKQPSDLTIRNGIGNLPYSSSDKFFITGKAEGEKKNVNFEDLFELKKSHQFSHDCQKTIKHQNSMLQQRRNSFDFKSQVRRDDQLKMQNKNTQGINQQASECPVIFLQSEPQSYAQNYLPSFYPSQLQNLTSSHMESEETLNTKQPSDLSIRNGIGNLNFFPQTLGQSSDVYNGNKDDGRISLSNTQTQHLTSQPIKFVAIESDQHVQRRVPVYFHDKKPYIAYLPSKKYEDSRKVIQNQPRIVPCMKCANSTVFCHQNVSTLPPVAHQNSFPSTSQGYHIDKAGNATIPEVRFIKNNNVQNGVQVVDFDDWRLAQMYMTG